MDSYYNLRLTENYVDSGIFGDEMINGTDWDMHRYAPDGNAVSYEGAIVYVTSWLHDVANSFFGGDYSVKEVAFWTGAIIASLCGLILPVAGGLITIIPLVLLAAPFLLLIVIGLVFLVQMIGLAVA